MGFDRNKVKFSEEALDAAEKLDAVLEGLLDGIDPTDVGLAFKLLPVIQWVAQDAGSTGVALDRLFALLVILKLDNLSFADLIKED